MVVYNILQYPNIQWEPTEATFHVIAMDDEKNHINILREKL